MIDKVNIAVDVEPNLFEGDIVLPPYSDESSGNEMEREKRNAQRLRRYIWTGKIVPYVISDTLLQQGYEQTIRGAIDQFTQRTCIKWKPRENEERWITFEKKSGCYSSVGMNYWKKGSQTISLGSGCNHAGITMHEMMHAIGFWHEQSRYDRDKYVEIMWENIEPGKEHNFNKYDNNRIDYLNEVYDTGSIMHYGKISFSKNGQPTIQAIGDSNAALGQRNHFSNTDIAQMNALYDCSGPNNGWSSWTDFGPCNDQCKHTRQRFCASHDLNNCEGADHYGIQSHTEKCSNEKCLAPIDGHWGKWSSWSSCNVSCDKGTYSRTRHCNEPKPKNGGNDCDGDDKQVGECVMPGCHLGPQDCEFEAGGLCHWTICEPNKYPRWYHHQGPTSSSGTGPSGDHTSGSGNYIYFEASSPAQNGGKNCFFSQVFPAGSCPQLTFWYHMVGSGMGKLSVQTKDSNGNYITVWEKSGEQGNEWKNASVEVTVSESYQVYFEGVRGGNFRGDIAIDDIAFKACSVVKPAVQDSCDFDGGNLCDWTNHPDNPELSDGLRYDWIIHSGGTPSQDTGPTNDITARGQGGYIYLDSSTAHVKGSRGALISKEFPGVTPMCLHFWYHMYASRKGMGQLRVFVQKGAKRWLQYRKAGNKGKEWIYKKINLRNKNKTPYKIVFEGERGRTGRGDVALDGIKMTNGLCQ
ncbi:Meprin A subunit beta [Stylophora pistillata]|uniref:Metalloendopeptidase n=2 Tax=Stylophora pistillata TaxID=50429 RepID=A0A2B4SGJ2_STYPI|nr:Meprin A subunit beta [Stylophora pistillata]